MYNFNAILIESYIFSSTMRRRKGYSSRTGVCVTSWFSFFVRVIINAIHLNALDRNVTLTFPVISRIKIINSNNYCLKLAQGMVL